MNKEHKIIGSVWFSTMQPERFDNGIGQIGIVLMNNGYEDKAYIGVGVGIDEKQDAEMIAERGGPFPVEIAKKLI